MKIFTQENYKFVPNKDPNVEKEVTQKVDNLLDIFNIGYIEGDDGFFISSWEDQKIKDLLDDIYHMDVRVLIELQDGDVLVVGWLGRLFCLSSKLVQRLGENCLEQLATADYHTIFNNTRKKLEDFDFNYLICPINNNATRLILRGFIRDSFWGIPFYDNRMPKNAVCPEVLDVLTEQLDASGFYDYEYDVYAPVLRVPALVTVEQIKDILCSNLSDFCETVSKLHELPYGNIEHYTGLDRSCGNFEQHLAVADNSYDATDSPLEKGRAEIRKLLCRAYILEHPAFGEKLPRMCEELTGGNYKSPITEDDITKALDYFKV